MTQSLSDKIIESYESFRLLSFKLIKAKQKTELLDLSSSFEKELKNFREETNNTSMIEVIPVLCAKISGFKISVIYEKYFKAALTINEMEKIITISFRL